MKVNSSKLVVAAVLLLTIVLALSSEIPAFGSRTITSSSTTKVTTTTIVTSATTITSGSTTTVTTGSTQTAANNRLSCSYMIFQSGSTTDAENCVTGSITYSGTLPEVVINDAIAALTDGGSIFIQAGTYTFTTTPIGGVAAIGTSSVSNIELYGEGNSTILSAGTNLNAAIIGVLGANGWYIHDLQINGNRATQSASGGSQPYLMGVELYDSSNDVVEHCYIHDEKTYGMQIGPGTSNSILYNQVVNSNANGIILYGGSNYVVEGNVVNGASDVGISISGVSSTSGISYVNCIGNIVENINLGVSPFGVNSAAGIFIGDNGIASNVIISANQIYSVGYGIYSETGGDQGTNVNLAILGNQISSVVNDGIGVEDSTSVSIQGNTISKGMYVNATTVSGIVVENNIGYNPIGKVTNFISSSTITPYGSSSSLTASTTYTIAVAPVLIIFQTTGTAVSLSINGGTRFAVTLGESFTLYPGQTINFGAYGTTPTLQVSFS